MKKNTYKLYKDGIIKAEIDNNANPTTINIINDDTKDLIMSMNVSNFEKGNVCDEVRLSNFKYRNNKVPSNLQEILYNVCENFPSEKITVSINAPKEITKIGRESYEAVYDREYYKGTCHEFVLKEENNTIFTPEETYTKIKGQFASFLERRREEKAAKLEEKEYRRGCEEGFDGYCF